MHEPREALLEEGGDALVRVATAHQLAEVEPRQLGQVLLETLLGPETHGAGREAERFVFVGFRPTQAKARRELLSTLGPLAAALVFYEAPHRVRETVAALAGALDGTRPLVIARELTKKFELIARLPLGEADAWFEGDANRSRGEFVLVVDAPVRAGDTDAQLTPDVERWLAALLAELPPSTAARVVAAVSGVSRELLYERATALKGAR